MVPKLNISCLRPRNGKWAIPVGAYPRYSGFGGEDAHNDLTRLGLRYPPFGGNLDKLETSHPDSQEERDAINQIYRIERRARR